VFTQVALVECVTLGVRLFFFLSEFLCRVLRLAEACSALLKGMVKRTLCLKPFNTWLPLGLCLAEEELSLQEGRLKVVPGVRG
jgi:hypothetical protein